MKRFSYFLLRAMMFWNTPLFKSARAIRLPPIELIKNGGIKNHATALLPKIK
jgi:hypothetical protein